MRQLGRQLLHQTTQQAEETFPFEDAAKTKHKPSPGIICIWYLLVSSQVLYLEIQGCFISSQAECLVGKEPSR